MQQASYDVSVQQYRTWDLALTWTENSNPVNLTGWTGEMSVRKSLTSETALITKAAVLGGVAGTITLGLSVAETSLLPAGSWLYDVKLSETSTGKTITLVGGDFIVQRVVTQ